MLYNSKRKKLCTSLLAGGLMCIAGLVSYSCSDKYDLDSEQPSGLNTLYGYLKSEGNFTNFLQLIDDCGYADLFSKTGSVTLFAANDEAFEQFYASNDWGVKSYSELSDAQKKLLLNSAQISNPYPTSMLSTAQGPVKGEVCRRASSQSLYDSVPVLSTSSDQLPDNPKWNVLKATHDSIVLFEDNSGAAPMVHFTPKFLSSQQLVSSDIDFLYNDPAGTRQDDDTYVNRAKILSSQFCKNGFVHVVDRVITPLDNMAEIIRKNKNMSTYSSILERFSAPAYGGSSLTAEYYLQTGNRVDSVYVKRYFSKRTNGSTSSSSTAFTTDKDNGVLQGSLKYDPGWNYYLPEIANPRDGMMEDMAVMIVPSNEAIEKWWNGTGKVLQNEYGTLENTPVSVLQELVNVNQLTSLVASLPSRFETVLNDANEPLGITSADVDSVYIGCNGVVYLTNKVFAPTSYSSVLFPAVIDANNFSVIKTAIDVLNYDAYLNSMVSTYSFFLPTNEGLLSYIDPVSYGSDNLNLWEFHYDATRDQISADVYECTLDESGNLQKGAKKETLTSPLRKNYATEALFYAAWLSSPIGNRMTDLLDNIIGVEPASADHHYVVTKGKNYVKVGGTLNSEGNMTAAGSFQQQYGQDLTVKTVYQEENGNSYVLDGALMGTRRSVIDVLADVPEFSDFFELVQASSVSTTADNTYAASTKNGGNLVSFTKKSNSTTTTVHSLLSAFHYTMYVPTNEAMQIAYAAGLPTIDDINAAIEYDNEYNDNNPVVESDSAEHLLSVVRDFVKYHLQSNSIYMDGGFSTGSYESARTKVETTYDDDGNPVMDDNGNYMSTTGALYRINVTSVGEDGITLQDVMGNTVHVLKTDGLYNIPAREYWLKSDPKSSTNPWSNTLSNSSSVVMHAIDRPLLFDADQFKYVPRVFEEE